MADRIITILTADEAAMPAQSPCGITFGQPRREADGAPGQRSLFAHDWACTDAQLLAVLPPSAQIVDALPADWRDPPGIPLS